MANYGYIYLDTSKRLTPDDFEDLLKEAVVKVFEDRMVVHRTDFQDDGPVWIVSIPGTREWNRDEGPLSCDQEVGFAVALQSKGSTVAFRHSPNPFEGWAQGCIEEQLSETFGLGVTYDASGETSSVGEVEYRRGRTFREYLARNFPQPLSETDQQYIDQYAEMAPPGWK